MSKNGVTRSFRVGELAVEVYENAEVMGKAAAEEAAERMRSLGAQNDIVPVVFATGNSQMTMLETLTSMPDLPWEKVIAFHMDEYLGISDQHPASFRRYMREHLTSRVKMREFHGVDGDTVDPEKTTREYAELLRRYNPQLCLLGIGENGHLAFNDPSEANFEDPLDVKVVTLDQTCRQQQVGEGWFKGLDDVPKQAITLTIPTLFRIPQLILSVPGKRKAQIVRRTLTEEISTTVPATIMRRHPHATLYLDPASASELPSS